MTGYNPDAGAAMAVSATEDLRSFDSRAWTGLEPAWWEEQGVGVERAQAMLWSFQERCYAGKHAVKALLMLWGPAIPDRPLGSWRRGWSVYDGHVRERGDDWTFWRAILATVAIITLRRWGQAQVDRLGDQYGFDMGFWDFSHLYGGWACMVLQLYPGCRVEIYSDGDSSL